MRIGRTLPSLSIMVTVLSCGMAAAPPAPALPAVQFGLVGIARGQTMRVNIVNALPVGTDVAACDLHAIFADQAGLPFGTRSDDWIALVPGQATWIDLPAALVFARDASARRARVRTTVEYEPDPPTHPPNSIDPCSRIVSTLEVFDNFTGRTSAFESQPVPPTTFGLVGLARRQTLALTTINLAHPPDPGLDLPPSPCVVALSFLDATGQAMRGRDGLPLGRRAALLPGEFLALNLPAALTLGASAGLRVPVRALVQVDSGPPEFPDACAGLTNTLELVDTSKARTSLIYAAGAQAGAPGDTTTNRTPHLWLLVPNVSWKIQGFLPTPIMIVGSGFTQNGFVTVTMNGASYGPLKPYNCSFNVNAFGFTNVNTCLVEIPVNVPFGSGTITVTDFGTPSNALGFSVQ